MLINTFWKIVLKIIGLWLLFSLITVLPQFISSVTYNNHLEGTNLAFIILGILIGILVYVVMIRLFLFQSEWLITTLKLEKSFKEERIDLSVTSKTALTIATIVMGGLAIIGAFPKFISLLFEFLRQRESFKNYPDSPWLIMDFLELLLGYLLLTNGKTIAEYILKKSDAGTD